jgi:glycosyltransferase involved in cell wall biosynthesis
MTLRKSAGGNHTSSLTSRVCGGGGRISRICWSGGKCRIVRILLAILIIATLTSLGVLLDAQLRIVGSDNGLNPAGTHSKALRNSIATASTGGSFRSSDALTEITNDTASGWLTWIWSQAHDDETRNDDVRPAGQRLSARSYETTINNPCKSVGLRGALIKMTAIGTTQLAQPCTVFNGTNFGAHPASPGRCITGHVSMPVSSDVEAVPLVAVIMPFYNGISLLGQTLFSLHQQTFQNFAVILVDDASTDTTSVQCLEEWSNDSAESESCRSARGGVPLDQIRLIRKHTRRGLSNSRNLGVMAAQELGALYVYLLDSDDLIEPTTIEKLVWFMETHDHFSWCGTQSIGFGIQTYVWTHGFHEGDAILRENTSPVTVMMRTQVFTALGGMTETDEPGFLEDWDMWVRAAHKGFWGHTLAEPLFWYRRKPKSSVGDWVGLMAAKNWTARFRSMYPLAFTAFPKPVARRSPYSAGLHAHSFSHVTNALAVSRKRSVLFIIPWFMVGGADRWNLNLVRSLRSGPSSDEQWQVTVVATRTDCGDQEQLFLQYTNDVFCALRFVAEEALPNFLLYLIGSRRPDVVLLSNTQSGYSILPWLRGHAPGPLYMDFVHMEEPEWRNGGYAWLSVQAQPFLDGTMVASQHLKQWMVENGARNPEQIDVVYIGVDTSEYAPDAVRRKQIRAKLKVKDDTLVALYAARLTDQKQPLLMSDVFAELKRRGRTKFLAIVIGDGPLAEDMHTRLEESGLIVSDSHQAHEYGRVLVLGRQTFSEMYDWANAADVYFLPSKMEGIASVFFEAMSLGLYVIGADVGGQRELVGAYGELLHVQSNKTAETWAYVDALEAAAGRLDHIRHIGIQARSTMVAKFDIGFQRMWFANSVQRALERSCSQSSDVFADALLEHVREMAANYLIADGEKDALWQVHIREQAARNQQAHGHQIHGSGALLPVGARWPDGVVLVAAGIPKIVHSGSQVSLTFLWSASRGAMARSFLVFCHLRSDSTASKTLFVNADSLPRDELGVLRPTDRWKPGEYIVDVHNADAPVTNAEGIDLFVEMGLYDVDTRQNLATDEDPKRDSIRFGPIRLIP